MCDFEPRNGPLVFPKVELINDTIAAQRRYNEFNRTAANKMNEAIKNHNQLLRLLEAYRTQKRLKRKYYTRSMMNLKRANRNIQRLKKAQKKHNSDIYLFGRKGTLYGWRSNGENYRLESEYQPYCREGAENVEVSDLGLGGVLVQSRLLDLDSSLSQSMGAYDVPQNEFQRNKFEFKTRSGRRYQSGWYPKDTTGKKWVNAFGSDEEYELFIIAIDETDQIITSELFFLARSSQPNCSKVSLDKCGRTRGCEVKTSNFTRKRYCANQSCSDADEEQCGFRTQCEWRKSSILGRQESCRPISSYPKKSLDPIQNNSFGMRGDPGAK